LSPLKFTLNATVPPKDGQISIETILQSISSEAKGDPNIKPPIEGDKYLRTLSEKGYYENFDENDFAEFKAIANLLGL